MMGTVVGDCGVILRTTDGGVHWSKQYSQIGHPYLRAVSFADANIGTAVGDNIIIHTADGGVNWTKQVWEESGGFCGVSLADVNTGTVVGRVFDSSHGMGGWINVILGTTDGGVTWVTQWKGAATLSGVSFADLNNGTVVGNLGTILSTSNGGATWVARDGQTTASLYGVSFADATTGTIVGDRGIILNTVSGGTTSVEMKPTAVLPLPGGYVLSQNYPNPFNPSTTIKFELPKTTVVRLSVYDLLGREVSVLVNDKRDAGVHEVKFDGANLASGAYFYRMQAGDFTLTKRLLLLR
jgi:hypothetical protein